MPTGLYVHIPFCIRKCHYCNFVIAPSDDLRLRADYLKALEAEITEARRKYGPIEFDTVYLGGGTPSALSTGEMDRVFELLRQNFSWKADAEVTVEVNPGEVDAEKLAGYRKHGINRISLGVQSTQDSLLKMMNRAHDAEDARRTARMVRDAGFENISMDLIIRLPNQKVEDVAQSIIDMVEWGTHQIVAYDLAVHNETHFGVLRRRGQLALPTEEIHERMFTAVEEGLAGAGFGHYEVSSFARPGYESRHNLIYWRNQPYLGLGPGAFSYMGGVRYQYARTVARYVGKALKGNWSNDEEDALSPAERDMETLLTGLRLSEGFETSKVPRLQKHLEAELPALAAQGLVEYDDRMIRLTRKGRYLAESVFTQLTLKVSS